MAHFVDKPAREAKLTREFAKMSLVERTSLSSRPGEPGPADLLLHYTYLSRVSLPDQTFYSLSQGENSCAVDVCIVLGHDSRFKFFCSLQPTTNIMTFVKILPVWSFKQKKLDGSRDFFLQQIQDQPGVEKGTQEIDMLFFEGHLRDLTQANVLHIHLSISTHNTVQVLDWA